MPARDTDLVAYMRNAGRVGSHTDNSGRFHRTVVLLTVTAPLLTYICSTVS